MATSARWMAQLPLQRRRFLGAEIAPSSLSTICGMTSIIFGYVIASHWSFRLKSTVDPDQARAISNDRCFTTAFRNTIRRKGFVSRGFSTIGHNGESRCVNMRIIIPYICKPVQFSFFKESIRQNENLIHPYYTVLGTQGV